MWHVLFVSILLHWLLVSVCEVLLARSALTSLKYEDPRFENASVEFDEVALAPTYRLLWVSLCSQTRVLLYTILN